MNHYCPVIKLFMNCQPEAKGICSGKNNLHSHCRINIRQYCCGINKITDESHFINKHIFNTKFTKLFQIFIQCSHCIGNSCLNINTTLKVPFLHFVKALANHRCFAGSPKSVDEANFIQSVTVKIILNLRKTIAFLKILCLGCKILKICSIYNPEIELCIFY